MARKTPDRPQAVYVVSFDLGTEVRYLCVNATGGYVVSFNTVEEMEATAVAPMTFSNIKDARKAVRVESEYRRAYGAKSRIVDSRNLWADWWLLNIIAKCPYAVSPRSSLNR